MSWIFRQTRLNPYFSSPYPRTTRVYPHWKIPFSKLNFSSLTLSLSHKRRLLPLLKRLYLSFRWIFRLNLERSTLPPPPLHYANNANRPPFHFNLPLLGYKLYAPGHYGSKVHPFTTNVIGLELQSVRVYIYIYTRAAAKATLAGV